MCPQGTHTLMGVAVRPGSERILAERKSERRCGWATLVDVRASEAMVRPYSTGSPTIRIQPIRSVTP